MKTQRISTTATTQHATVPLSTRLVLSASAGCIASTFCHPLDVVRVQMQTTKGEAPSPFRSALTIAHREGILGLWSGLSAAYLRQFTYSGFRMAVFSFLLEHAKHTSSSTTTNNNNVVPLSTKLVLGAVAGVAGSIVGNPAELVLVRMADDSKLPQKQRRNYKSSIHACIRIVQEEGVKGLGRGMVNSCCRAAVVNAFQLGIYGPTKEQLVILQPSVFTSTSSIPTMFCGALFSAFFAISASMPLDVVKSRLMAQPIEQGKPLKYTGMLDCFRKSFRTAGIRVFWRGFIPAYIKLAPYTVISFTALEKLTALSGSASAF